MNQLNRKNRIVLFIAILFIPLVNLFADFGLVLSEGFIAEHNDKTVFASKTTVSPWLSIPLGGTDFYMSMGMSADYEDKFTFFPELHKLEFSYRFPVNSPAVTAAGTNFRFGFRLGRILWQDPALLAASGFFDGLDVFAELGSVRLGAAAFYTGFLYRNTANINISPGDLTNYNVAFDWNDFEKTYFAPRRLLTSLYSDFPGFPFGRGGFHAGLLAQFDFSDAEEAYHTQYLLLRYIYLYKRFDLTAAGAVQLENTQESGQRTAYAFSLEGAWQTWFLRDRLALGIRWASGDGPDTSAFFPVVREAEGIVLKTVLSGMMTIRAHYEARLMQSLSAQLEGRYFIRTDSSSFADPYIVNDSYLLGAELDAAMVWVPVSDLSFSLSGGVFIPKTGKAMASDAPLRWTLNLTTIFSF